MAVGDGDGEAELWAALRAGRRDDVVSAVLGLPEDRRRRLRPAVRRHERLVGGEPIGVRAPAGEWDGELRPWHQSAAVAALLGCSTLEQAVTYTPLDVPDAVDLPKAFFPDHLEAFAQEWSAASCAPRGLGTASAASRPSSTGRTRD